MQRKLGWLYRCDAAEMGTRRWACWQTLLRDFHKRRARECNKMRLVRSYDVAASRNKTDILVKPAYPLPSSSQAKARWKTSRGDRAALRVAFWGPRRKSSIDAARTELEEVREFARQQGFEDEVKWWDVAFWAERLREARYNINEEELRPYFALPNVLEVRSFGHVHTHVPIQQQNNGNKRGAPDQSPKHAQEKVWGSDRSKRSRRMTWCSWLRTRDAFAAMPC
eukprot:241976-Chlamydomonas_euryale.AAC.2